MVWTISSSWVEANCRIEGTVYGRLRLPPTAPHA